jgi:hypothetical protein
MNLKPNLWTVLFLITAVALYYVWSSKNSINTTPNTAVQQNVSAITEKDPKETKPLVMRGAFMRDYQNYLDRYVPAVKEQNVAYSANVANAGILAYELAYKQLEDMYSRYDSLGDPRVYVYPVIRSSIPENSAVADTLDLYFLIKETGEAPNESDTFYDFTRPCPPTCDTVPYVQLR